MRRICLSGGALLVSLAWAQPAVVEAPVTGVGAANRIQPTLGVDQTFSDNYRLSAANKSADSITRLTGGVRAQARSAEVQGFLDYALTESMYAEHTFENSRQQNLNSSLSADLLEKRLIVNAGASINRRAVSAFGATSPGTDGLVNANSTEVRSLRIAPALRGEVAGGLTYGAEANWTGTNTSGSAAGNNIIRGAGFHLAPTRAGRVTWALDLQHQASAYRLGRSTSSDRVFGSLGHLVDAIDTRLNVSVGRELSDLATAERQGRTTVGLNAAWQPSPITQATADYESRAFGHTHQLGLTHRTPLTVWQFSTGRSLNYGSPAVGQRGTAFDLFYAQLASVEPDPIKRVDRVLSLLQRYGLDPNARSDAAFLSASATLVDRVSLSAAWRSGREAVVFTILQNTTRRADPIAVVADDLAAASTLRTRSVMLNASHTLTPQSTLAFDIAWQDASGILAAQHSRQRLAHLVWNQSLSQSITASIGARHGAYELPVSRYSETALTAQLAAKF